MEKHDLDNILLEMLYPYRVYQDHGVGTPEGGQLMTLVAGFREKADAEFFKEAKSRNNGKKYILKYHGKNVVDNQDEEEKK